MALSGNLKTMDLAELLQWVTMGRKNGALAFVRDKIKNYIYFRDGRIISSRSNEPNKQLGHFLLFQGKITEAQLKHALEVQAQGRQVLGKILVSEGYVSQEDVEKALKVRTQEVIYDLFLWEDGYFQFLTSGYSQDELIIINLDLNSIIFEGVRRKDEWARIRSVFPNNEAVPSLRTDADLKSTPLMPLHKKLLFLMTLKKTISEIILEVHGSDFLVNYELFQLYEKGIIEISEIRPAAAAIADPVRLFNRGLELVQRQKYTEAISVFQEVLRLDPQNSWADEQIELAEKAICEELYRNSIKEGKVPFFLVPESALARYNLTHQEGFVASRINGTWDVKSIVMLSPLREIEILQTLDKLKRIGLIDLR
jgi:tetratricopeptide (TPR) repeat protein